MDYIKEAMITSRADWEAVRERLSSERVSNLLHAAMGINTESGELTDVLKKYIYYGKDIDHVNFIEELGDLCWYIGLACSTLDVSFEEVMRKNIEKLRKRYGDGFSEEKALNRDLKQEREILERNS